jgi:porin
MRNGRACVRVDHGLCGPPVAECGASRPGARARDGWGFFGQVSFADQGTSPITTFFDVGLGGNGLIPSRRRDELGLPYAYTDLSEELKNNLDLLPLGGSLQVEHQLEMFYDRHLTPWLQLTGDLQILRPNRPAADTAVVPAVRLRVVSRRSSC